MDDSLGVSLMDIIDPVEFEVISVTDDAVWIGEIHSFLQHCHLGVDRDIELFVIARKGKNIIACAGLAGNTIKCVAVDIAWRGEKLSVRIVEEVAKLAAQRGNIHLFLYTRPENKVFFRGCGFFPIAEVPGISVLLENTPVGIARYRASLQPFRKPGERIGCIVMNANPFTLGHRYLVEQALQACDWLHIFVASEDVSQFPFVQRLEMVRQGVADLSGLTVHPGTGYLISRATFPSYFLKEQKVINETYSAMDLLIFRRYIAPALGITHRFVGTEPHCAVTAQYNDAMHYWLEGSDNAISRAISVVEIDRKTTINGRAISASDVRQLLRQHQAEAIEDIVPKTTLPYLQSYCLPVCTS